MTPDPGQLSPSDRQVSLPHGLDRGRLCQPLPARHLPHRLQEDLRLLQLRRLRPRHWQVSLSTGIQRVQGEVRGKKSELTESCNVSVRSSVRTGGTGPGARGSAGAVTGPAVTRWTGAVGVLQDGEVPPAPRDHAPGHSSTVRTALSSAAVIPTTQRCEYSTHSQLGSSF